jgi:hypothetical protein
LGYALTATSRPPARCSGRPAVEASAVTALASIGPRAFRHDRRRARPRKAPRWQVSACGSPVDISSVVHLRRPRTVLDASSGRRNPQPDGRVSCVHHCGTPCGKSWGYMRADAPRTSCHYVAAPDARGRPAAHPVRVRPLTCEIVPPRVRLLVAAAMVPRETRPLRPMVEGLGKCTVALTPCAAAVGGPGDNRAIQGITAIPVDGRYRRPALLPGVLRFSRASCASPGRPAQLGLVVVCNHPAPQGARPHHGAMPGGTPGSSRTQTTAVATTTSARRRRCGDPLLLSPSPTVRRTVSAHGATSPTGTGRARSWPPVSTIITVGSNAGARSSVSGRPAPCARVGSRPDPKLCGCQRRSSWPNRSRSNFRPIQTQAGGVNGSGTIRPTS